MKLYAYAVIAVTLALGVAGQAEEDPSGQLVGRQRQCQNIDGGDCRFQRCCGPRNCVDAFYQCGSGGSWCPAGLTCRNQGAGWQCYIT
ncbi:unnamed protein product [Zymoseptoria tritici ST99CH_3D1]|nr:unnamed protein product [Zymoseptoria tritici ST99CH_3D1]